MVNPRADREIGIPGEPQAPARMPALQTQDGGVKPPLRFRVNTSTSVSPRAVALQGERLIPE